MSSVTWDPQTAEPGAQPQPEPEIAPRQRASVFRSLLRFLWRRKSALAGLILTLAIVFVAVFPGLVAPSDPLEQNIRNTFQPPIWQKGGSAEHPLGTDPLGRDVLSRLIWGARYSLSVSLLSVIIGAGLGFALGLVSGFFGKAVDTVIMRLADVQLAFPFLLFAIAVLAVSPNRNVWNLSLVMGFAQWPVYARLVRSKVLSEREKEYARAAEALGASRNRVLVRYVLPNSWQVVPVVAILQIGGFVIVESILSFLMLGISPPTPSWGAMLNDGRQYMAIAPYLPLFPGVAILITVLSINLGADGLADFFDPKLAKGGFRRYVLPALGVPAPVSSPGGGPGERALPLLRVRNLTTVYPTDEGKVTAVRNASFDLERGKILGVVGESGSGKSTLGLSIIQLLDVPGRVESGQILLDGYDLVRVSDKEMGAIRGRRIGMIFQNPGSSLNPVLRVGQQLAETFRRHGRSQNGYANLALSALSAVGIAEPERVLGAYPFELSGGMQQRVMIALAMAAQPELLIADEPTTALDVTTQVQLLDRLDELRRKIDASVIFITHDIALLADFADMLLIMYAGQICELGPRSTLVEAPLHPYTRALLDSVARVEVPGTRRLASIPGETPDLLDLPPGCPFAPRCPQAEEICRRENPALLVAAPGHEVACHVAARRLGLAGGHQ